MSEERKIKTPKKLTKRNKVIRSALAIAMAACMLGQTGVLAAENFSSLSVVESEANGFSVVKPQVEYTEQPIGIDVQKPHIFGWKEACY